MHEPAAADEGIANHTDPESCVGGREAGREALTGAHAGQVLSSEITNSRMPTLSRCGEGDTSGGVNREASGDPAESKTLGMRGNSSPGDPGGVPRQPPDGRGHRGNPRPR